jgi:glycogen operon protein
VFRRRRFFKGVPVRRRGAEAQPDISWFRPDGSEMNDEDWGSGFGKSVAVYLNGLGISDLDARGQRVTDDSFFLCFNAHHELIEFTLPPGEFGPAWLPVVDTAEAAKPVDRQSIPASATVRVAARATVVLQAAGE